MPHRLPWIERRFTFDLPLSMFPSILERLRGTPARAEDRLRGQDPALLRTRLGGGWSILENVGHLLELEGLWLGRLDDFAAGLSHLRPAGMSSTEAADYNSKAGGEVLEPGEPAAGAGVVDQDIRSAEITDDPRRQFSDSAGVVAVKAAKAAAKALAHLRNLTRAGEDVDPAELSRARAWANATLDRYRRAVRGRRLGAAPPPRRPSAKSQAFESSRCRRRSSGPNLRGPLGG